MAIQLDTRGASGNGYYRTGYDCHLLLICYLLLVLAIVK